MNIEFEILNFIRDSFSGPFMDVLMKLITFLGDEGWFWIVSGVVLSIIPKTRKIGFTVCLSMIFSLLVCNLTLKPIIARTRPYDLIEGIELIISAPTDFSFPSGHSSVSFAAAVAIFMHNKKYGSLALVLAGLIAFSRLYLYVHFPSDVIAGSLLGALCGVAGFYAIRGIYNRFEKN